MTGPAIGEPDEHGLVVVRINGPFIVAVMPMIFNDRIVLSTRVSWGAWFIGGWCYDKGVAAHLAANIYDPMEAPRPVGYKKEAYFSAYEYEAALAQHKEEEENG